MPPNLQSTLDTPRTLASESADPNAKTRFRAVERGVLSLARKLDHEKKRSAVEVRALRAELQDELIAREATAARNSERQRAAFELPSALPNALQAIDKAAVSTALIEVAVRSLDTHALKNIGETEALVADVNARL